MIRTLILTGSAAVALALTGCGNPAPSLASYDEIDQASGQKATCLFQEHLVQGWTCSRWRITETDGTTYTKGNVK